MIEWAFVLAWFLIVHWTPAACVTAEAERYAVATVMLEGGAEPQLAQELMMGALIGRYIPPWNIDS